MRKYRKAILLGFLAWLIGFVISLIVFPFRASDRGLFDSVMGLTVAALAVLFSLIYFRRLPSGSFREGLLVGVIWLAVNIGIDLPLFLSPSPMQMSAGVYLKEIGLSYLTYPIVTAVVGYLLEARSRGREEKQLVQVKV